MIARLWHWLRHPRAPWVAVALGILLTAGSLGNGLVLDDLYHRRVLLDGVGYLDRPRSPWDLFSFFGDDPAVPNEARRSGVWPWWMGGVVIRFFRPVSSLTHALDYALWPDRIWLMHLHSLLWLAALLTVVAFAYRKLLGPGLATGLSTLAYALDGGHGITVGWLATRNMIVAATFAIAAFALHDAHRRRGFRLGAWLSPLVLLLGLCSAELALGIMGYFLAYALFLEPARGWRRALTIAPHLGVVAGWAVVYRALGFGTHGTGLYTHPVEEPGAFLGAVAERWPVLVTSQMTLPFSDVSSVVPGAEPLVAAVMLLLGIAVALYLFPALLRDEPRARMLAAGALMAAVPCCTTFPHSRLLILVAFGFFGLLGLLIARHADHPWPSRGRRLLAGVLVARHLALAPLLLVTGSLSPRTIAAILDRASRSLPSEPMIAKETLVVVNAPHAFLVSFVPALRQERGLPAPRRLRTLGTTMGEVRITREDEQTVLLETPGGYLEGRAHQVMWDPADRRDAGYHVDLGDMTVTVLAATADGRPETIRVHFTSSPTAAPFRWVVWHGDGFVPFALPEPGQSATIAPLDVAEVVFGSSS